MGGPLKSERSKCADCENLGGECPEIALLKCYTMPTTSGLRGYTGLSVERPAGDFGRGMSTSGARSLSKGANAIRR